MNALHQKHRIRFQLEPLAVVFPNSRNKIILRHFYFLSVQQRDEVTLQGGMVDGLEIVEIVGAIRQFGRIHTVDEIVIR